MLSRFCGFAFVIVLDFYCAEDRLAIELDGAQHVQRKYYDERRAKDLQKLGIKVIRFWDNDVLQNMNGVLEQILITLDKISVKEPHPALS